MRYARNNTNWYLRVEMDPIADKGPEWLRDEATIYASSRTPLLFEILKRGRPIVNCMAHHEPMGVKTVRVNDLAVGEMAAKYLLQKGFERFFYYCGKDTSLAAELRYAGFARALIDAGYSGPGREFMGLPTGLTDAGVQVLLDAPKPLAMLVSHDTLARELAELITSAGLAVPEQVAILGVDDDELQSEISRPPCRAYRSRTRRSAAAPPRHFTPF